jgi:hypothetical protein
VTWTFVESYGLVPASPHDDGSTTLDGGDTDQ